jgi:phosphomannomutase/phosphoglucomutase
MKKLFGTDGVRGVINKELSIELAMRLGLAIGTFFGEGKKILIGRDVRQGGDMIERAVEAGLLSTGISVYSAGLIPTPGLQYAVKELNYDGGIVVTASHNPPEFNGIKVIDSDGIELKRKYEEAIEEIFYSGRFNVVEWKRVKEVQREERALGIYFKAILSQVETEKIRKRNFTVVVDGANSVGSLVTPVLARELGAKVIGVNTHLDPFFPSRLPEPNTETLRDTAEIVKASKADLGVAHDGDADRAIFIDSKGMIQMGDRSASLLCEYVYRSFKDNNSTVYTAVSSSLVVEDYLSRFGIKVKWTKVGSVDIAHMVKEERGLAGFEENGGFIYPPHQYVRDGAMTFALMLNLLADERGSSYEVFNKLPKYYTVKSSVPMREGINIDNLYEEVINYYRSLYNEKLKIITVDGVKIIGEGFWVLIRKSGTEPIIRILAESKNEDEAKVLMDEARKLILSKK